MVRVPLVVYEGLQGGTRVGQTMGICRNFSMGRQHQAFANLCQVPDDAVQMPVYKTLCPFCTTTPQRKCPMLQKKSQKMRFIGSHSQV